MKMIDDIYRCNACLSEQKKENLVMLKTLTPL